MSCPQRCRGVTWHNRGADSRCCLEYVAIHPRCEADSLPGGTKEVDHHHRRVRCSESRAAPADRYAASWPPPYRRARAL